MTQIKFCGIRRPEDVEYVNEVGPDYIGFVFWPGSSRYVTPETAAELSAEVRNGILKVGVFMDADLDAVVSAAETAHLDMVQLHGSESDAFIGEVRSRTGLPVIKAFKVGSEDDVRKAVGSSADYIMLDSGAGTGRTFDWSAVGNVGRPFFLAGGLNPGNVQEAVSGIGPMAVDVSSGIETNGYKDPEKMKQFKYNVREADTIKSNKERSKMTNPNGRFGNHGGQYIPETLMNAVIELEEAYNKFKDDPEFNRELSELLNEYANRPSRLYFAKKMTEDLGGAKIYLKREDLNHTGAHKINNVLGQALLAKKMGKTRLIAETGAGQHGVATATAAALLGMECLVYMGVEDMERQALNVYRMRLLGAEVRGVPTGTGTLKDAVSQCMREWTSRIEDTHYCLGSVMGPHPFPTIVRDFQSVIGKEIRQQMMEKEGRLPDMLIACVGGGSNAIGTFYDFIGDKDVELVGAEAAGKGIDTPQTAATINTGSMGIFHGMKSYFCQDKFGQIAPVYSISAGLDYPGIGPEHAWLHDIGRARYVAVTDDEAVEAFEYLSRTEGIIPAIESSHALAYAMKVAPTMPKGKIIVVTVSGRGDKDVAAIARYRGEDLHE